MKKFLTNIFILTTLYSLFSQNNYIIKIVDSVGKQVEEGNLLVFFPDKEPYLFNIAKITNLIISQNDIIESDYYCYYYKVDKCCYEISNPKYTNFNICYIIESRYEDSDYWSDNILS